MVSVALHLTDQEIANAVKAGGWTSTADIAIGVAIALAESGGYADATHRNSNGTIDYGLMQVNSVHGFPVAGLMTPVGNTWAGHQVYLRAGSKWTPWSTYKSGAYLVYLPRGRAVAGKASATATHAVPESPATGGASNPFEALSNFAKALTNPLTWIRIGMFILGSFLLLIALFKLTGDNKLSDTTKSIVKATVGAAVIPK